MRILISIQILVVSGLMMTGCDDSNQNPKPLDILKGNEDLQQEYNKKFLKHPVLLQGTALYKKSKEPAEKVTITAQVGNTSTKYTTFTKADGSFSLYAEGQQSYKIYAEKTGYDRSYYFSSSTDSTTFLYQNITGLSFNLLEHDPTPVFKITYVTSVSSNLYYFSDLSFNGTNLLGIYYNGNTVQKFSASGNYISTTPFQYGMYYFACQGTDTYWAGTSNNKLSKINVSNGSVTSMITMDVPSTTMTDVEYYNNNLWLLSYYNSLFKVSMTGSVQGTLNFSEKLDVTSALGLTQANNYLYVLLKDIDNQYLIYKVDPSTTTIISKGYLPITLNGKTLSSLAFDKTYFWTIDRNSVLIKLSLDQ